jgi:hypothetical protein
MPQSTVETNIDGYRIVKLPLEISSQRAAGVRVNKIYIENITNSWVNYVFKIKDEYCDYSNVSNLIDSSAYSSFYSNLIPDVLNHQDFHTEYTFDLIGDNVFNFSITFEPLSEFPVTGIFASKLYIEFTNLDTNGDDSFMLNISGECLEQRVGVIDGVSTSDNSYTLKIHNIVYEKEFIRLG